MPREIYNEGRVVGLSAYETYVKQHLSEDPNTPPATEREWLASSLAMGSSLLLKVPNVSQADDAHTFLDIYLPTNSKLAAANTIVATFFDGDAVFSGNWATKVTDYGQLISNTSSSSPSGDVGPTGTVPRQTLSDLSDTKKQQLSDYIKIYDGVVIQPGNWVDNTSKPPQKDFKANLANPYPRVRLHVLGPITSNPLILLTGFTIRSVLAGTVGQDTSVNTTSPQDGDFLGPAVFPWAAKIVFSVPSSYMTYLGSDLEIKNLFNASNNTKFSRLGQISSNAPKLLKIKANGKSAYALMMSDNISSDRHTEPTRIQVTDKPTSTLTINKTNANDNINWATLLGGLTEDKDIDLLGDRIKSAKYSLIENEGYLEFGPDSNKTRLYISKTEPDPTDVPVGSIGIGWGFSDSVAPPTPEPDPGGGTDYSAFGNIRIGNTDIQANGDGDTLTLVAGKGISLVPDVANRKITVSCKRKYIFIGDSYGTGYRLPSGGKNWIQKVVEKLGLSSSDYYQSAVNASGFSAGTKFQTQLESLSVQDPTSITDIVVCGGWNDAYASRGGGATLKNDVKNFVNSAKSRFPNATVHIGMISWMDTTIIPRRQGESVNPKSLAPQWDLRKVLSIYRSCGEYGAAYIENSQYLMHRNDYFVYDGLHPNDAGNESIASGIVSYLLGGSINVYNYDNVDFTLGSGLKWNITVNHDEDWNLLPTGFFSLIDNEKVGFIAANRYGLWLQPNGSTYTTIRCQGFYNPSDVGQSGSAPTIIHVGTFGSNSTFRGGDYNELSFRGSGWICAGGTWYTVPFLLTMLGPDKGENQSNKLVLVFIQTTGSFNVYNNVSDIWLNYPFIQMYGDAMFC